MLSCALCMQRTSLLIFRCTRILAYMYADMHRYMYLNIASIRSLDGQILEWRISVLSPKTSIYVFMSIVVIQLLQCAMCRLHINFIHIRSAPFTTILVCYMHNTVMHAYRMDRDGDILCGPMCNCTLLHGSTSRNIQTLVECCLQTRWGN